MSRLLSGLRSSKGKRVVQDEEDNGGHHLASLRCSTKRINDSKPLDEKPETPRFGENFVFFPFLQFEMA